MECGTCERRVLGGAAETDYRMNLAEQLTTLSEPMLFRGVLERVKLFP